MTAEARATSERSLVAGDRGQLRQALLASRGRRTTPKPGSVCGTRSVSPSGGEKWSKAGREGHRTRGREETSIAVLFSFFFFFFFVSDALRELGTRFCSCSSRSIILRRQSHALNARRIHNQTPHRWQGGNCRFGDRCNFAHGQGELRRLPPKQGRLPDQPGGGLSLMSAGSSLVRVFS